MVTWTVEGVAKLIPQFIMILGMPSILHVCDKSDSRSVKEYSSVLGDPSLSQFETLTLELKLEFKFVNCVTLVFI